MLALILAGAIASAQPGVDEAAHAPSVLAGTIAELTWPELEREARDGAIALWAIGSIEEHGPHLPLATDAIVPMLELAEVRKILARHHRRTVVIPPYYWGVNNVTGAFAGSFQIRPETMTALLVDVLRSIATTGFKQIYLVTGHYDAAHNIAISKAVSAARMETGLNANFVVPRPLAVRLALSSGVEGILVAEFSTPASVSPDLHAGANETGMMLAGAPESIRRDVMKDLPPTNLSSDEVARWRKGGEGARRLTPAGYLGAPAQATAKAGASQLKAEVQAYAAAILAASGAAADRAKGTEP